MTEPMTEKDMRLLRTNLAIELANNNVTILLEELVSSLLAEVDRLRAENAELREEVRRLLRPGVAEWHRKHQK